VRRASRPVSRRGGTSVPRAACGGSFVLEYDTLRLEPEDGRGRGRKHRDRRRELGLGFPREVRILAIPVSDPITFSTEMTPAVAACYAAGCGASSTSRTLWVSESGVKGF